MKRYWKFICLLAVMLVIATTGRAQQPEPSKQYARRDLECGIFVPDPNHHGRVYYVGGLPGIGVSDDNGRTFIQRSTPHRLTLLYVHPRTSTLFVIAEYTFTQINRHTGKPDIAYANKILTSDDEGKSWRDISGKQGYIGHALYLFQDPDHTERVCVFAQTVRGNILQAVDDEYSDWKWFMETSWHKPTPKDDFNYPKEICPRFEKPK